MNEKQIDKVLEMADRFLGIMDTFEDVVLDLQTITFPYIIQLLENNTTNAVNIDFNPEITTLSEKKVKKTKKVKKAPVGNITDFNTKPKKIDGLGY